MRDDDEAAFSAFVRSRQTRLVWVAEVLCAGGRADAEDLVQTALIRLASHWGRVDDPDAWVRRVMGNLVIDRARQHARRPLVPVAEMPERQDVTARFEEAHADADQLSRALARLPARQRRTVVLRYLTDLSELDTARELDVSVGAVKSASSRALGHLREFLDDPTDAKENRS